MSSIDYNSEALFNEYHMYGCVGGYKAENKQLIWDLCKHSLLLPQLGISPGETVLIVGAGFGWIAEKWIGEGIGPICCTDISAWIQSAKSQHATVPIYDYDVTDYSTHDAIKQVLGLQPNQKIDWCITEDLLIGMSDQEGLQVAAALRDIGTNVVHYVGEKPYDDLMSIPYLADHNWKDIEDWAALYAPDRVILRPRSDGIPLPAEG